MSGSIRTLRRAAERERGKEKTMLDLTQVMKEMDGSEVYEQPAMVVAPLQPGDFVVIQNGAVQKLIGADAKGKQIKLRDVLARAYSIVSQKESPEPDNMEKFERGKIAFELMSEKDLSLSKWTVKELEKAKTLIPFAWPSPVIIYQAYEVLNDAIAIAGKKEETKE